MSMAVSAAASSSASGTVSHIDFTPGSIKRIELTNFMTHSRLVLVPSSRVNFIIGVNGSGKSSLVCALCLCLGGTPGDMVRGTTLSTFVMKGKDTAEIEVTLAGRGEDKGDFAIKRIIHCAPSKTMTEWQVNRRGSSEAEVKALLRALFHIQMDNPCMFLPQEKVGDFTMLNPQAVLRHTMHAVAMDLEPLFDGIVALQERVDTGTSELDKLKQKAEAHQKRLTQLQADKDRFVKYEALGEDVMVLKQRLTHCKMRVAEKALVVCKDEVAELEAEGRETGDVVKPLELAKARAEGELAAAAVNKDKAGKALREAQRAVDSWNRKRADTMRNIDESRGEVESMTNSVDERRAQLVAAEAKAAKLQAAWDELESHVSAATLDANYKMAKKEAENAASAIREMNQRKDALEEELQSASELRAEFAAASTSVTTAASRMKVMAASSLRPIADLYQRVVRNENFHAPVIGPIIAHVDVRAEDARIMETAIPKWVQLAFITQSRDDAELLKGQSTMQYDPARLETERATYRHEFSPSEFADLARLLGPIQYADELLLESTPAVVRVMLNREAFLHDVIVASEPDAIERLLKNINHPLVLRVRSLATGEATLRQRRGLDGRLNQSRMGCRTSSDYLHIREDPAKRLAAEARAAELMTAEEKLRAELQALTAPIRALKADGDRAKAELTDVGKQIAERRELKAKLTAAQKNVTNLSNSLDEEDAKAQAAAAITTLRKYQLRLADVLKELPSIAEQVAKVHQADVAAAFEHERALDTKERAQKAYEEKRASQQNYAMRLKQARAKCALAEEKLKSASTAAHSARSYISGKKEGIIDPLRAIKYFDSLPEDEASVQADLAEKEVEHKLLITDTAAMEVYAQTERAWKDVTLRIQEIEGSQSNNEEKLNRDLTVWRSRMDACVQPIHDVFCERLRMLHVTGLVQLECDPSNVKRAGLNVKVSFRKGEAPQRLHKDMQSGGERALTTMMFLMALQRVARVPFRIVDEINQGVDAPNERSLMETVVQITNDAPISASHGRQLFIISPKLLPDLTHAEGMRTHVIVNGSRVTPGPADATALSSVFQRWLPAGPAIVLASAVPAVKGDVLAGGAAAAGSKRREPETADASSGDKATKKARKVILDTDDEDY